MTTINSEFAQELENLGFTVSYDSVNDSWQTLTITANYVSLEYKVTAETPSSEKLYIRENENKLYELFQKNGYTIETVGEASVYFPAPNAQAAPSKSVTVSGETLVIYC